MVIKKLHSPALLRFLNIKTIYVLGQIKKGLSSSKINENMVIKKKNTLGLFVFYYYSKAQVLTGSILCCRYRKCIGEKMYLPLPNEVLTCVNQVKKLKGFCVPYNVNKTALSSISKV